MAERTLEAFLADVAAEAGAKASKAGVGTEFHRGRALFAVATGNATDVRLDPEIAEAVLGTPDTTVSTRGPGWVRLALESPTDRDLDRAKAWFLSAWRNAGE